MRVEMVVNERNTHGPRIKTRVASRCPSINTWLQHHSWHRAEAWTGWETKLGCIEKGEGKQVSPHHQHPRIMQA